MKRVLSSVGLLVVLILAVATVPAGNASTTTVAIRGQRLALTSYPATGTRQNRNVLFAPGDAGLRGWAVTVAQAMASWGYDVYVIDTKDYLESFTPGGTATLKEGDVMADFRDIARRITNDSGERMTLVGWSEGAGLTVLAGADPNNKRVFNGVITFGLGDENALGWTWKDTLASLAGRDPNEPTFHTSSYVGRIAPLPLMVIQASRDTSVTPAESKNVFSQAREPRQYVLVDAGDHKFGGGQTQFFQALSGGLQWIRP